VTLLIGSLGAGRCVDVDALGVARPAGASFELTWWLGVGGAWTPAERLATRTRAVSGTPVSETAARVGGGEVLARWYGLGGPGAPTVLEVENATPAPVLLALVVRPRRGRRVEVAAGEGPVVRIGREAALVLAAPPRRWAAHAGEAALLDAIAAGGARDGAVDARDRGGRLHLALLAPVGHRLTWRAVLLGSEGDPSRVDVRRLPSAADAAAGWRRVLERGLRVELPDDALAAAVELARATVLLRTGLSGRGDHDLGRALEEWGFDEEAALVWQRLRTSARWRMRRRAAVHDPWAAVQRLQADPAACAPALLAAARDLVASVRSGGDIDCFPHLPAAWLGQQAAVHALATRAGPVSFALRWHGARPALLWEAPGGCTLRASRLDPAWSSSRPAGEALLAPVPPRLLDLRTAPGRAGRVIDEPGSFA
jgi:hypothetical protein